MSGTDWPTRMGFFLENRGMVRPYPAVGPGAVFSWQWGVRMRRILPVVQIVGLLGCDPEVEERPTANPPQPEPLAGNPPEPADVITPAPLSQVGELNAQSAKFGRVYTTGLGNCGVDVPLPPDAPRSSGISLNLQEIECPAGMHHPAFQACSRSILARIDAESCFCTPVTGNPPMPGEAHDCPE